MSSQRSWNHRSESLGRPNYRCNALSYAGDLWTVARTGGSAIRITSGIGTESEPAFSPDGSLSQATPLPMG